MGSLNGAWVITCSALLAISVSAEAAAHELVTRTIDGRTYLAYLPEDYATRTEPMQVLMALHPATFDAAWFQAMSRFEEEAAAADVVVIYPDGSPGLTTGLSWDAADPRGISRGDSEFLMAVFDDVATLAPTENQFALTGFSAGALMTYQMLGEHGDLISAAVPYGAYYNDSVIANSDWPDTVPILHMHGTDDARVNPITGTGDADNLYNFGVLADHMQVVAEKNNGTLSLPDLNEVQVALDGAEVVMVNDATSYVLIDGVAHYWPRFLNGNGPNGSAAVMAFVTSVPEPSASSLFLCTVLSTLTRRRL